MKTHHTTRRSRLSRILVATLTVTLTIVTFVGLALAGAVATDRQLHQPVPTGPAPATSAAYAEPGGTSHRLVVAFVAGHSGTIASDLLAPYDIFASSPAFTTYVVAADAAPAPLEGGPAVVPTFTFADVDTNAALQPDLVVVPGLTDPTGSSETALRQWVSRQHDEGARVLGVCSGAMVLAATGMLDGLDATSHWSRIKALQASHPAVHWVRGQLYVDDGNVTTTAAVTSGVQGALHLLDELAGPKEAQRVADLHPELGWTPPTARRSPRTTSRLRTGPSASTISSPGSGPPSGSPWTTGSASSTPPPPSRCTHSPRRRARSLSPPRTACAPGTDSSSSPPARRRHPTCPGSSFPAGGSPPHSRTSPTTPTPRPRSRQPR